MGNLVFVTKSRETYEVFDWQLNSFLGEFVNVRGYCLLNETESVDCFGADLVVLSTEECRQALRLGQDSPQVLLSRRSLDPSKLSPLFALEPGTKVLVVNNAEDVAKETAELVASFGLGELCLIPWWPGIVHTDPLPNIAITPGLTGIVPASIRTVHNIGTRPIGVAGLVEIAILLGVPLDGLWKATASNWEGVIRVIRNQADLLKKVDSARYDLEAILDSVHDAVLMCDERLRIRMLNSAAALVLGVSRADAVGKSLEKWFSSRTMHRVLRTGVAEIDQVQDIRGRKYVVTFRSSPGDGIRQTDASQKDLTQMGSGQENQGRTGTKQLIVTARESRAVEHARGALMKTLYGKNRAARYVFEDIIGQSEALERAIKSARRLAMTNTTVFIQGETGTGKELFAHAIHNASPMRNGPFVAHNIAALPEQLIQSELFGYESGAFTGARREGKAGLFELADKGTLFLDEIAEMSPAVQVSLLRVLQEREITRVGGSELIPVNVRVIAATNQDLSDAVRDGRFRKDLYYRLCAFPLRIPPLRERSGDVPILLRHFIEKYMKEPVEIDVALLRSLNAWSWPGNVRELEELVRYSASMSDGPAEFVRNLWNFMPSQGDRVSGVHGGRSSGTGTTGVADGITASEVSAATQADRVVASIDAAGRAAEFGVILDALSGTQGGGMGRTAIASALRESGIALTQGQIRLRLVEMARMGLVQPHQGRTGSTITGLGRAVADRLREKAAPPNSRIGREWARRHDSRQ
ncbi:MAG: sigma-54 interaction domain-containing protein [Bacillota bacterium]